MVKGIITAKYNQLSPRNEVIPPANICAISINNNEVINENKIPNIKPFIQEKFFTN